MYMNRQQNKVIYIYISLFMSIKESPTLIRLLLTSPIHPETTTSREQRVFFLSTV